MTTTKEDTPQETNDGGLQPAQPPSSSTSAALITTTSVPDSLEQQFRLLEEEAQTLRESEARFRQQYVDSQRRERILSRRLAAKEQDVQDYASQVAELKTSQAPGPNALRTALLDPAVNILFQKLKLELQATKAKMDETQNELSAWKFTPDSNNGKRLMAKCRLLHQENEELGKMTSNGRLAKLEGDLALQKNLSEEVKKSQSELDDFLQELDEDVEGMQSTIFFLQQELKLAKDTISSLESELNTLRTTNDNNGYGTANEYGDEDENVAVMGGVTNKVNGQTIKSEMRDVNNSNNDHSERTSLNNGLKHNNSSGSSSSNSERTSKTANYCNGDILDHDAEADVSTPAIITPSIATVTKKCNEQNNDNNFSNSNNLSNYICKTNESTDTLKITISLPKRQRSSNYDSDSSEYSNNDNDKVEQPQTQQQPAIVVTNSAVTGATTRTRSRKPIKKQRRTSFLSLDTNDEDNEMTAEIDDSVVVAPPVEVGGKMLRSKSNGSVKKLRSKADVD